MDSIAPQLFDLVEKLMKNKRNFVNLSDEQKPAYLKSGEEFDLPLDFVKNVCKVCKVDDAATIFCNFYFRSSV